VETIALHEGFTENGQYSFGFKAKKNGFYQAEAAFEYGKYYVINFSNYLYLDYGEVNNFQFDLVPNGKLRLVYKNINCFDENDEFFLYYFKNLDVPNYMFDSNPDIDINYGCAIDVTTSYSNAPAGTYEYKWYVTRNNVTTEYIDTIVLSANEMNEINIQY